MEQVNFTTTDETFKAMQEIWNTLSENHSAYTLKGNKSAASRSRKACSSLKKLASLYRKLSVTEIKAI